MKQRDETTAQEIKKDQEKYADTTRGYFGIKYDLDELKIRLLGKRNLDLVFLKVSCLF